MLDDDFDALYDEDWAVLCTRSRPGEDDQSFRGVLAVQDVEAFEAHVVAGQHQLQYPTAWADLAEGDTLQTVRTADGEPVEDPQSWRVLAQPRRVVDGSESIVYLAPDPNA